MAITTEHQFGICVVTCEHRVNNADIVQALQECAAMAEFTDDTPILLDDTASAYRPGMREVRKTGKLLGQIRELRDHRIAVLTASELNFGLARMVEVFTEMIDVQVRVFRDRGDALAWLRGEADDR